MSDSIKEREIIMNGGDYTKDMLNWMIEGTIDDIADDEDSETQDANFKKLEKLVDIKNKIEKHENEIGTENKRTKIEEERLTIEKKKQLINNIAKGAEVGLAVASVFAGVIYTFAGPGGTFRELPIPKVFDIGKFVKR